jgi:hypothetical protein
VTGQSEAINDDPNTQDITAWSTTTAGSISIATDTTSPTGNTVLRCTATGPTVLTQRLIPIDSAKNYQLRLWTRQQSGSSTTYLTVAFYDTAGNVISGGGTPGWLSLGTFHYWGLANQALPAAWTEYRISFGPNESASMPAGAKFVRVGFLANYTGVGVQDVTGVKLMLKSDSDLIVDGAVIANKIAANAVVAEKIAANAVTADKILANAVTAGKIAANAVTANTIAANAVTANAILAGAITADKIAANAVTANAIAAGTITGDKIAANTIAATSIVGGSITATQIAAGAIGVSQLAAGSVTAAAIAANAVVAGDIAAGAVTAGTIAANAVTATEIAAGAVIAGKIAANAVTANEIAAATITGSKIAALTITGNLIQAGAIAADKITVANLSSINANLGSITGGSMNIGSGKFQVDANGNVTISSATTGARLEITNSVIRVFDTSGNLRVKMGFLL